MFIDLQDVNTGCSSSFNFTLIVEIRRYGSHHSELFLSDGRNICVDPSPEDIDAMIKDKMGHWVQG